MKVLLTLIIALVLVACQTSPAGNPSAGAKVGASSEGFILVEGGSFRMGDGGGRPDQKPLHDVTLSSFAMGSLEVTQKQWLEVMGTSPSHFKGDDLPIEQVKWADVVEYCNKRSAKEGLKPCYSFKDKTVTCNFTASGYRLPTEAEWEFAARGGTRAAGFKYVGADESNAFYIVAWSRANSNKTTHPVGTKAVSELGLYDMTGNVAEYCWDWYGAYSGEALKDPTGPSSGPGRVVRGGSYDSYQEESLVSIRTFGNSISLSEGWGFRVVRRPIPTDRPAPLPAWNTVRVEGGTFMMGSDSDNPDTRLLKETPAHQVTLSSYDIGKYEVTQGEWRLLMGSVRVSEYGENLPMQNVSWYDAIEFCNRMSVREGLKPCYSGKLLDYPKTDDVACDFSANGYRLPTEAEWEFAARGGNLSKGYAYAGSDDPKAVGWLGDKTKHPVGTKAPNELGIFDMSGSVPEWCWDWALDFGDYRSEPQIDPAWRAAKTEHQDTQPVVRGGRGRVVDRDRGDTGTPYPYGFRLVRRP